MGHEVLIPINDRLSGAYVAAAGQTLFDFDFPIFDDRHISVQRTRAGVVAMLVIHADYEVIIDPVTLHGQVQLLTGADAGDEILLIGATPYQRVTDFSKNGSFRAHAINTELDLMEQQIQQLARMIGQALLFDYGAMPGLLPAGEEGQLISFDENGNVILIDADILSTPGADGRNLYLEDGAPADSFGVNGESYIDRLTLTLYKKIAGTWESQGTIKGDTGPAPQLVDNNNGSFTIISGGTQVTWYNGVDGLNMYALNRDPDPSDGVDGESWVNFGTMDLFVKMGGTWFYAGSLKGDPPDVTDNGDGTYTIEGANGSITVSDGADGETPTLTNNGDGTYTIATTAQSVILSDGVDGETPTVTDNGDGSVTIATSAQSATVYDGNDGLDGSSMTAGSGAPDNGDGADEDLYINLDTGDVYEKAGGVWLVTGNLKGSKGDQGDAGTSILSGDGAPDDGDGNDGDRYVDLLIGDWYVKGAGVWSLAGNIRGPKGDPGDPLKTLWIDVGKATTQSMSATSNAPQDVSFNTDIGSSIGAATFTNGNLTVTSDMDVVEVKGALQVNVTAPLLGLTPDVQVLGYVLRGATVYQGPFEMGYRDPSDLLALDGEINLPFDFDFQNLETNDQIIIQAQIKGLAGAFNVLSEKTHLLLKASAAAADATGGVTTGQGIVSVKSVADMRALDVTTLQDQQIVRAEYLASPGDQGGGDFIYDATSIVAHDGIAHYQPVAGAGRFIRRAFLDTSWVMSQWAGWKGDNSIDEAGTLNALISLCVAHGKPLWMNGTPIQAKVESTIDLRMSKLWVHWNDITLIATGLLTDYTEITQNGDGVSRYSDRAVDVSSLGTNLPLSGNLHCIIDVSNSSGIRQTGKLTIHNGGIDDLSAIAKTTPGFLSDVVWPDQLVIKGGGNHGIGPMRAPGSRFKDIEFRSITERPIWAEGNEFDDAVIDHISFHENTGTCFLNGSLMNVGAIFDGSTSLLPAFIMRGTSLKFGTAYGESRAAQGNASGRETLFVVEDDCTLQGTVKHGGGANTNYGAKTLVIVEGRRVDVELKFHDRSFVQNSSLDSILALNAPNSFNQRLIGAAGDFQGVPERQIKITLLGDYVGDHPVKYYDYDAALDHPSTNDRITVLSGEDKYRYSVGAGTIFGRTVVDTDFRDTRLADATPLSQWVTKRGECVIERLFDTVNDDIIYLDTIDGNAGSERIERSLYRLKPTNVIAGTIVLSTPTPAADNVGREVVLSAHPDGTREVNLVKWTAFGDVGGSGLSRFVFPAGLGAQLTLTPGDNQFAVFKCLPVDNGGNEVFAWVLEELIQL